MASIFMSILATGKEPIMTSSLQDRTERRIQKTILATGQWIPKAKTQSAITLIEVLAFIGVLALVVLVVVGGMRIPSSRLASSISVLRKDFQALYFEALNKGEIIRLSYDLDTQSYKAERFLPPQAPPPEEDREAYREWEEQQEAKKRELEELGYEEQRSITLVQRGFFEEVLTRQLPEGIELENYYQANQETREADTPIEFLIYPTGEFPSSLWIFKSDGGEYISFVADGLSGHARTYTGRITQEEWLEGEIE